MILKLEPAPGSHERFVETQICWEPIPGVSDSSQLERAQEFAFLYVFCIGSGTPLQTV